VKTFYYGCGGYITKGKSVCEMNPIHQEVLEKTIIDTILNFYKPLLDMGGRRKLAEAVKTQIGSEAEEFVTARKRARIELDKNQAVINNLLDNITPANREFVDERLEELRKQKCQIEARLEELDQLSLSQIEINSIVSDSMKFIAGLEFILREGFPQDKLVSLRQCVKKISINKPAGYVKLTIYLVPTGNIQVTQEIKVSL
jgi:hypothetical protein